MSEITSTADMAEDDWDSGEEPQDARSDIVATHEAEGRGIEFHVSMRDYTQRDMEELIIEAAARMIVGRHNDREMAKLIEAKCIEQITARADQTLRNVTAEIIDQPITPGYGDKKPVTMREFLGLYGREYLSVTVDNDGKPSTDNWGKRLTRMEWLVRRYMDNAFKTEIEKATNAAINEIKVGVAAKHKALLDAEKARFREYIDKAAQ